MLRLDQIKKDYHVGNQDINALRDIKLAFRQNEFVAVLGPSGCGKTTLLNILGGLDRYSSGDLVINGKSTKHFSSGDWDAYRNRSVGFVLQNYYLIPHLSVIKNVEMAQILAGVSKKERKERALEVLKKVGLEDQIYKRPNQLSGGQMQRVSIARALINNPDIILADEPTGALDSKTSVQIVDLLKEIAKERLVIMVTHNEQLASSYASRLIRLFDGEVVSDSNPFVSNSNDAKRGHKEKTSMSLLAALGLSGANLWTKKMRTLLTSFAASIGIIGIALILAISSGLTEYIDQAQSDTLANFPLSISPTVVLLDDYLDKQTKIDYEPFPSDNKIFPYQRSTTDYTHFNTISLAFEDYVNKIDKGLYNAISFKRGFRFNIMGKRGDSYDYLFNNRIRWRELFSNDEYVQTDYEVIDGTYPKDYTEIALVVDKYNRLQKTIIDELGMDYDVEHFLFEDFIGKELKIIPNDLYYRVDSQGAFYKNNNSLNETLYNDERAITLKITGILRVRPGTTTEIINPGIVYTKALTDVMLRNNNESQIVKAQVEFGVEKNVFTGKPFQDYVGPTGSVTAQYQLDFQLQEIGGLETSTEILIYPKSFDSKNVIKTYLDNFNVGKEKKDQILYNDYSEVLSKTIGRVVTTITYVLIAFSAISLFVSSIMIGIITYISVIERIKEIGLLRSLGARKKDISRVFIAETMLIGLVSGLLGMMAAFILTFPINNIIEKYTEVADVARVLPRHAFALIGVSIALTLVAGFIPSRIASKKDPVVALRTE